MKTKIFLDSGDPGETREAIKLLGFLDGQTTNPSLISKNPETTGKKFTKEELFGFYGEVVREISGLIPEGSISVEVYADKNTAAEEMLKQGREMFSWIPVPSTSLGVSAHIKFPATKEGLKTAQQAVKEGMRVNMTLCFSQEQAAAVYAATRGAKRAQVYVSPFIGRLDDRGENGMDLIENIIRMYGRGDCHVEVLTASVRNLDHLLYALYLESDIITSPFKILKEWAEKGMSAPGDDFVYERPELKSIPYKQVDLQKDWTKYAISHELTDIGIERFSADWNSLLREA